MYDVQGSAAPAPETLHPAADAAEQTGATMTAVAENPETPIPPFEGSGAATAVAEAPPIVGTVTDAEPAAESHALVDDEAGDTAGASG